MISVVLMFLTALIMQPATCADRLDCLLNEARIERGLPPLVGSQTLALAAQTHAEDMARRGQLSHYSEDGATPWDRAMAVGHPNTIVGEVIAGPGTTTEKAFQALMNSPPHAEIILSQQYTSIGVGMAVDAQGRMWWCADFGVAR